MTVEDLINQQASRNRTAPKPEKSEEEPTYKPESPEDDALFKMYHLKGYVTGPGFSIESF